MKITDAVILLLASGAAAIKNHRRSNEIRRFPNAAHRQLDDEERGGKGKGKGMIYDDNMSVVSYPDIKLIGASEVSPFVGFPFGAGSASLDVIWEYVNGNSKWYACMVANVQGFIPGLVHIHSGEIFENGPVVLDFTPGIKNSVPDVDGCFVISEDLFLGLVTNPDQYYINVHVDSDPELLFQTGIRGQIVQSFKAELDPTTTVPPFFGVGPATGYAFLSFEEGGQTVCFDVNINVFTPMIAHLHWGAAGTNGGVVFEFSDLKVAPNKFFGCKSIDDLGISLTTVCEILADPYLYYFNFHQNGPPDDEGFFITTRGQLPTVVPL